MTRVLKSFKVYLNHFEWEGRPINSDQLKFYWNKRCTQFMSINLKILIEYFKNILKSDWRNINTNNIAHKLKYFNL